MPANYVLLGEVTLTQTTSFITISNIPSSGYTDLKLVASVRALRTGFAADDLVIQFNGVTTGYAGRRLYLNGTSVSTDVQTDIRGFASDIDQTANVFGSNEFYIHDYLSSSFKSVSIDMVTENNGTDAPMGIFNGLWSNTAAINSIKVFCNNSNMVAHSTFSLYGLAAVGTTPTLVPFATGGDAIGNDGTYWYHAFYSSGLFAPAKELSCDYIVVGGGGGGGSYYYGGGGGAGGYRSTTGVSLTANTLYRTIIGAGGSGGSASSVGLNGNVSSFNAFESAGGGAGGSFFAATNAKPGKAGGSGGGGCGVTGVQPGGTGNTPSTSPAQGTNGGAGNTDNASYGVGGGGGGATVAGTNAVTTTAGSGGAGSNAHSSWLSVVGAGVSGYLAGGGGGSAQTSGISVTAGSGGAGGGGAGVTSGAGNAGTVNTGSGGSGVGGQPSGGGSGGSGIVIIRYPIA
jgi:hypothetical protein